MTSAEWLTGVATLIAGALLLTSAIRLSTERSRREVVTWNVIRVACVLVLCWFVWSLVT
jgi:hypothetical protein